MTKLSGKQPLYSQLSDVLRDRIQSDMSPGDLLPSERQLCERYGLSRTTVRLALESLENRGLIYRRHGKGTFVADARHSAADLSLCYSFTDEMRALGRVPSTRILGFAEEEATKAVSAALGLSLGTHVYDLYRLRLADGVPMLVGHTYLPMQPFPGLSRTIASERPLYDILEHKYRQRIATAEEEIRAGCVRPSDAGHLGIPAGAPMLEITRVTRNVAGDVIEYTQSVARADKFKYHVVHSRV